MQSGADTVEPLLLGNGAGALPGAEAELSVDFALDRQQVLVPEQVYYLVIEPAPGQQAFDFDGRVVLAYDVSGETVEQTIETGAQVLESPLPFEIPFSPTTAGVLQGVTLLGTLEGSHEPARQPGDRFL